MTPPDVPFSAEPTWRRYLYEVVTGFRTMLDVGMLSLGSALVGLAVAILLGAFDLVASDVDLSTAALLGSGVVTGVVGAFALGVASEGGVGRRSHADRTSIERLVGRLATGLLVGAVFVVLSGYLSRYLTDMPVFFDYAVEALRSAGVAAFVVSLVAVPALWGAAFVWDPEWLDEIELPVLYLVWALVTLVAYRVPGG